MLKSLLRFLYNLFTKSSETNSLDQKDNYRIVFSEGSLPEILKAKTLYILTEDKTPWVAAMICPSGCGERLEMNLLPDERPCWQYSINKKGLPSLYPSVDREVGCRAHFWLTKGRIIWAFEDTEGGL
jgi:hypothetical protein